jgi:hypothetical protein
MYLTKTELYPCDSILPKLPYRRSKLFENQILRCKSVKTDRETPPKRHHSGSASASQRHRSGIEKDAKRHQKGIEKASLLLNKNARPESPTAASTSA